MPGIIIVEIKVIPVHFLCTTELFLYAYFLPSLFIAVRIRGKMFLYPINGKLPQRHRLA